MDDLFIPKLCVERHENIKEILTEHETKLNNHVVRLDGLEGDNRELKTKMQNVCDKISDLISTIKWGLGILVTITLFITGVLINGR